MSVIHMGGGIALTLSMSITSVDDCPIRRMWKYHCESCGARGLICQTTHDQEPVVFCAQCFDEDGQRKRLELEGVER